MNNIRKLHTVHEHTACLLHMTGMAITPYSDVIVTDTNCSPSLWMLMVCVSRVRHGQVPRKLDCEA